MNYRNVKISQDARIAKQSVIVGDVTIGRDSCVLYYAVIRGDDAPVVIGEESNIQENCTIHVNHNRPVYIGNNVTLGHNAAEERYEVIQDNRGLIWISTFGYGLFVYNPQEDIISHYTYQETGKNLVHSNFLHSLLLDHSGNVWVGSEFAGVTLLSVLSVMADYIFLGIIHK